MMSSLLHPGGYFPLDLLVSLSVGSYFTFQSSVMRLRHYTVGTLVLSTKLHSLFEGRQDSIDYLKYCQSVDSFFRSEDALKFTNPSLCYLSLWYQVKGSINLLVDPDLRSDYHNHLTHYFTNLGLVDSDTLSSPNIGQKQSQLLNLIELTQAAEVYISIASGILGDTLLRAEIDRRAKSGF